MNGWINKWISSLLFVASKSCTAVINAGTISGTISGFASWLEGHSAGQVTPRPFLAMVDRKKYISIVTYSRLLNICKYITPNFLKAMIYLNIRNMLEWVITPRQFFPPTSTKKGRDSRVSHSVQKDISQILDIHPIGKLESYPLTTLLKDKHSKVLKQVEWWTFSC